ncbi:MAG: hypothetical protein OSJ61_26110 [Lachnospiraceae bacterium]|nr:hypothetical protein [Lachnospiraceae bacterium]
MVKVCLVVNTKLSEKKLHAAIKKSGYSIRERFFLNFGYDR